MTDTGMLPQTLVLHFDVNKTIVMTDPSGRKDINDVLNEVVATTSWGTIEGDLEGDTPPEWRLHPWSVAHGLSRDAPSIAEPSGASLAPQAPGHDCSLINYKTYIDLILPYPEVAEEVKGTKEGNRMYKVVNKRRIQRSVCFTHPGEPGEAMRPHLESLMEALRRETSFAEEYGETEEDAISEGNACDFMHSSFHYLLPSFIDLLCWLPSLQAQQEGLEVYVVFRTFGEDLPCVVREYNALCAATAGLEAFAVPDSHRAAYYRDGKHTAVAYGTVLSAPLGTSLETWHAEATAAAGAPSPLAMVCGTPLECHASVLARLDAEHRTVAIADHWYWWAAHGEVGRAGKLHFVTDHLAQDDLAAHPALASKVEVFFDDFIRPPDEPKNIVDVRCALSGEPVQDTAVCYGRSLVPVTPFQAVLDRRYFIDHVQRILGLSPPPSPPRCDTQPAPL